MTGQLGIPPKRERPFAASEAKPCPEHGRQVRFGCPTCIRFEQDLRVRVWLDTRPSLPVCRPRWEDEWGDEHPVDCGYPMAPVDFGERGDGTLVVYFRCPTHGDDCEGAEASVEIR